MEVNKLGRFILIAFLSTVSGLTVQELSDQCLNSTTVRSQDLLCSTPKKVNIQKVQLENELFYCIHYEKKTGNKKEFDILSFEFLNDDFSLEFTGANLISDDVMNPKFKLFDTRSESTYKGRFVISSSNLMFDIKSIKINDDEQVCMRNRKKIWPVQKKQEITTVKPVITTTETPSKSLCGVIKRMNMFGSFVSLPSWPGQFPWVVSVYRYFDEEEEPYYKCGGTIVGKRSVITSVNCLIEDGLLLQPENLQIYVSPYSVSAKRHKNKIFNIAKIVTHDKYNTKLENNIALVKLNKDLVFNEYVQPICLPTSDFEAYEGFGKLAGFGKSSSRFPPKSDILTEAEYEFQMINGVTTFTGENTSGNSRVSDIGSGLFVNSSNVWILTGISSHRIHSNSEENKIKIVFANVKEYLKWIDEVY